MEAICSPGSGVTSPTPQRRPVSCSEDKNGSFPSTASSRSPSSLTNTPRRSVNLHRLSCSGDVIGIENSSSEKPVILTALAVLGVRPTDPTTDDDDDQSAVTTPGTLPFVPKSATPDETATGDGSITASIFPLSAVPCPVTAAVEAHPTPCPAVGDASSSTVNRSTSR